MATIHDVAKLAGVSSATVSYVLGGKKKLSEATAARVLAAAEQAGYRPNSIARSLRTRRTHVIGVLAEDVCGMPVPELVDGISEFLAGTEYGMLLSNLRLLNRLNNRYEQIDRCVDDINRAMLLLEDAQVDGMIYVAMHDRRISGVSCPVGIPMVYAYATSDRPDIPGVTYDNVTAARDITQRFIHSGHRRIALVAGHAAASDVAQRLTGFRQAMDAAGLDVPAAYIRFGDWTARSGQDAFTALMSLPVKPTAVFFMNDSMAAGGYRAAAMLHLTVGRDVSIAGFDDRPISRLLQPPMTTVSLPNRAIGHEAARLLLRAISGEDGLPPETVLPCEVIDRESIGRCDAAAN